MTLARQKRAWQRPSPWLLLILLTAAFLRLHHLTDAPPGLTHDEADHGLTAWQIVQGTRAIYFSIGYGREPLYDYATALLMWLLRDSPPTYLAGRLTAVTFSLLLIAGMFAWVRRAFDESTALLTAAGLATSFWPLMTGRQMLRSGALPALFVLAVYFFWRGLALRVHSVATTNRPISNRSTEHSPRRLQSPISFLISGLFLGATLYTYIPARILWLVFPAVVGYLWWVKRPLFRQVWWQVGLMLLLTAVVAWPLFAYLRANPSLEVRLQELSEPLTAARQGNWQPLWQNTLASLALFTREGDTTWRYNIPGRPWLPPLMGWLFYVGLALAAWYAIRPNQSTGDHFRGTASFLALVWLLGGMAPVFVTGPGLSTTQAIGLQPVLYLFPALSLVAIGRWAIHRWPGAGRIAPLAALVLFGGTAVLTTRDYFAVWANHPKVRVQYETTLVTAMHYLNQHGRGHVAVSTITPGPFHSPAVALLTLRNPAVTLHWFDGRSSLLLPPDNQGTIIMPGFATLPPALAGYLTPADLVATLPLRPTDEDRPLTIYQVDGPALLATLVTRFARPAQTTHPVNFGNAADFLGYDLQTPGVSPGGEVRLATLWQVRQPLAEAQLFTHLQGADGAPIAQADLLGVPGASWQPGDYFIQLHQFTVPAETAAGEYPLAIGLCRQTNPKVCSRQPILTDGREEPFPTSDILYLQHLTITP